MDRPQLTIVHSIPGRLRVRLPPRARIAELEATIARLPGVTQCRWSPQTRSLLALYRPDEVGAAVLAESIAVHADVDPVSEVQAGAGNHGEAKGRSPVAAAVIDTVGSLNRRIARATRGRLSLGLLVPLALTLWAIRDATRGPMRPLPWSTALWYAHGLFRDYNLPPTGD